MLPTASHFTVLTESCLGRVCPALGDPGHLLSPMLYTYFPITCN